MPLENVFILDTRLHSFLIKVSRTHAIKFNVKMKSFL